VATLAGMLYSADALTPRHDGCSTCRYVYYTGHCGVCQKKTSCWDEPKEYCCAANAGECCDPDARHIVEIVILASGSCTHPLAPSAGRTRWWNLVSK